MHGKILIADDEPNILISLEYLMKREGHEVLLAHDGREALEAIRQHRPDVVLLDVMMPVKSGFDVCQRIRANPDWSKVRVVMLTAKGREVEVSKGLALGADDYITKPFATKELLARVRDQLAG